MPVLDGIEATRRLVASGHPARIVILTTFDLDEAVFGALRAGASGFMLKDIRAAELVSAIRLVARGEALLAPTVTRRLLDRFADALPGEPPRSMDELTPREVEVLRLVARALTNAEIAERPHADRGDGEVARLGHPAQARPARPRPGRRRRLRRGPRPAAPGLGYSGRSDAIAPMTFCSHGRSGDSRASWRIRRVANWVMSRRLPTTISGPVSA